MAKRAVVVADKAHAILGASSSERWMNCPGSVKLSAPIKQASSEFAEEGTAAHSLGEQCLREGHDAARYAGDTITTVDEDGREYKFVVGDDMIDAVQIYLDFVRELVAREPGAVLLIEQGVSLSKLGPPVDMFGTCDTAVYLPLARELHIVDYKHGAGYAVDAVGNTQGRYYGVGALLADMAKKWRVRSVTVTIVQPRAHHTAGIIRSETMSVVDLLEFGEDLIDGALRTQESHPLLSAGRWCKFCRAAAICPERLAASNEQAAVEFDAVQLALPAPREALTLGHALRILEHADQITDWLNAIRNFALRSAEAGQDTPGWIIVERHGHRKWMNVDRAKVALWDLGLEDDDLYTDPEFKSPAQIEKLTGNPRGFKKVLKDQVAELVHRPVTGTNLVRQGGTSRKALPPAVMRDFDVIENQED